MGLGRGQMRWDEHPDDGYAVEVARHDTYPTVIGRGALQQLPDLVGRVRQAESIVVVTDENVAPLLRRVVAPLAAAGLRVHQVVLPAGETSKSWTGAKQIIEELCACGVQRRTILVAFGGGMIVDLVGFVAAVFMRGLPYINVPTSLIGQLDAAIGGKTGIDFDGSKNLLGAFHHPAAILIDPDLLATLPEREVRSGLAEAVKVGMLDAPLFARLETFRLDAPDRLDALDAITRDAVLVKMRLLKDDPFEQSLERLLNLGHSVGHALEAVTEFVRYRHGEAVAIGIAVATVIGWNRGVCTAGTMDRVLACLANCGLEIALPLALAGQVWAEVDVVRRVRNGALNEVLPVSIGECTVVDDIGEDEFRSAVKHLAKVVEDQGSQTVAGSV